MATKYVGFFTYTEKQDTTFMASWRMARAHKLQPQSSHWKLVELLKLIFTNYKSTKVIRASQCRELLRFDDHRGHEIVHFPACRNVLLMCIINLRLKINLSLLSHFAVQKSPFPTPFWLIANIAMSSRSFFADCWCTVWWSCD